jgi:hypothetical protein
MELDPKFAAFVERLHPAFVTLTERPPVMGGVTPAYGAAERGIYLFTEGNVPLYVGRSNRLLARYKNHWMPNKTEREAAFAFKLAREATGFKKATYKKGPGSRKDLALDSAFATAFATAKARIRAMEYRWVEETDPTCQCLLEIYAAVTLGTPYNDFDTH